MGVALAVWLDYDHSAAIGEISETSVWSKTWMRFLMLVVAITFGMTIGYSRLFLGMHSLN